MSEAPQFVVIATGKPQGLHPAAQELISAGIPALVMPPPDGQTNT